MRAPACRLALFAALCLVPGVATPTPFSFHSYDTMVADLEQLAARFPELTELFTAQQAYDLPPVTDGGETYEHHILRITNEAAGLDKPEVLLVGVQHGDEVVGLEVGLETARLLLESYGSDPWLTDLVDRREIYVLPLANPYGFGRGIRTTTGGEGNNEDMNRDHLYDREPCGFFCSDEEALSTLGARAIHELSRRHLFRVMLDLHGGAELILHPWGSPIHTGNTTSPDALAADALGSRMRSFGGDYRGFYPVGTANDLLGPAMGPLDDTSYASSWDLANSDPAWPTDGWRALGYTIEISNQKRPPADRLGGDAEMLVPGGAEDGYVPKNVRISLAAIDLAEPWVVWRNRDQVPATVALGEAVHLSWEVRGCFDIDATRVHWGTDVDPRRIFEGRSPEQQDLGGMACFQAPTVFEADVVLPRAGTFFIAPVAEVDGELRQPVGSDPPLTPQSWIVRARSEEGVLELNAVDPLEINTVVGQTSWAAEALAIEVVGAAGLVLSGPEPGVAGVENTWTVSGATPGVVITFLRASDAGATPVPGCQPLEVSLSQPIVLGSGTADGAGSASLSLTVPAAASGRQALFQAIDVGGCEVTNRADATFE